MKPRKAKATRWQSCNVLLHGADPRQLWQFTRSGGGVKLSVERRLAPSEPLPEKLVAHALTQPRFNIAWLPASQVFVRVLEVPNCPREELPGMIEFQLESISPVPVGQAVWTVEAVPTPDGQTQSAIVVVVAREIVERFLGELEQAGYQADRLELPQLRQLLADDSRRDGVCISTRREGDRLVCLVAWWQQGRLRNLNLFDLQAGDQTGAQLADRLTQLAWAGEVEGWYAASMRWHLVADAALAGQVAPALVGTVTDSLERVDPPVAGQLAAWSAASTSTANLLPADIVARYRQQFVDRLWMRSLLVIAGVYVAFVVVWLGWLQVLQFQRRSVEGQVEELRSSYTNAMQLRSKVQLLQDQVALKFAALDCCKAACENLPTELTLTEISFQGKGRRLQLFGTVPADQQNLVTAFNEGLSKATIEGQPLFSKVTTKSIQAQPNRPAGWSIECELYRSEL